MKVAIAQICSGPDPWASLFLVEALIDQAEKSNCDLICFPENLFYRGPRAERTEDLFLQLKGRGILSTSDFSRELRGVLENSKIAVSLGSVLEASSHKRKPYNSHWFYRPGYGVTSYKKIHLFSFAGREAIYRESENVSAGTKVEVVPYGEFRLGLSICYDLRFPELYRELALTKRANVLLIPAAFTRETGEAHWHTLLRARAIENLSYVVAAAQWGEHKNDLGQSLSCYGHAIVYDPWGEVLAEASGTGDALLMVNLDLKILERRRKQLPVFGSVVRGLLS